MKSSGPPKVNHGQPNRYKDFIEEIADSDGEWCETPNAFNDANVRASLYRNWGARCLEVTLSDGTIYARLRTI